MSLSSKRSRRGHAETRALLAIVPIVSAIFVTLLSLRDGIRNGLTAWQLLQTAIIDFGIGLLAGVCFVLSIIVLFILIAAALTGWDFICRRRR